jgi:hypothetical protein
MLSRGAGELGGGPERNRTRQRTQEKQSHDNDRNGTDIQSHRRRSGRWDRISSDGSCRPTSAARDQGEGKGEGEGELRLAVCAAGLSGSKRRDRRQDSGGRRQEAETDERKINTRGSEPSPEEGS